MITLGSLFDGISGFPLAGQRVGIQSIWASEIEPFPIKVSKLRFSEMKQLGDITKINGAEIEPVDIATGGSPCQDMSIAGKRAGLAGERSGLFIEQIRIVKEMRQEDVKRGRTTGFIRPRFMVWENVPGAFSSNKGEDFRAVLEETARIADETVIIPGPPKGKWNTVGCIMGDGWSIAWRTMDAQYWGVPQRRRRIFLVADFGGQSAPEVLFKSEGLSRNLEKSREARKGTTSDIERGIDKAIAIDHVITTGGNCTAQGPCVSESGKMYTLKAGGVHAVATAYSFDSLSNNSMKSKNPNSGCRKVEVSKCIDTTYPCPSKNQGGIAILSPKTMLIRSGCEGGCKGPLIQDNKSATLGCSNTQTLFTPTYCIQGNCIDRADTAGCNGKGWTENLSYTLNTVDRPAVVAFSMQRSDEFKQSDKACTQSRRQYKDSTDLIVSTGYLVRRLTPLECERLQNFPDFWTDISSASDSARYKALGNSVAVCCPEYVLEGIKEALEPSTKEGD